MASTNIPVQLTSFIGRQDDLRAVEQLLSSSRLVTLTGPGGSGKTRLAFQVVPPIASSYEGARLVELAPLHEPALLPQFVVQALGLHPAPDLSPLELLLNYIGTKQMLLILDNCEHLADACAELILGLLSQSPNLRILATSREALAIPGESIYPVSGLAYPTLSQEASPDGQSCIDPGDLIDFDAVNLLVERGHAISPQFKITPENTPAIVEVCSRLDGMPLALELASARFNVLTIQEIASRLSDRFTLLSAGTRRGVDPRHHTLRATIDWSYDLLKASEQALLRRMAVFTTGCNLDLLEAFYASELQPGETSLNLISSLVNKSLVVAETTGRAQIRYRLLETIRQYLLEKLEGAGEAEIWRDRHLDLFLARAEEAAPKLGDAYQQLWLNWLEEENDNIRAALAWSLESNQIESGLRIAIAVSRFWEIRGYVAEAMAWFERLLAQADESVSLLVRANAFTFSSFLAMFLGDSAASTACARQAVALAESAGEEGNPILILALGGLSAGAAAAGDYQTAFAIGERTLPLLRVSPMSPFLLGMCYLGLGNHAVEAGHFDKARELLSESLRMAREAGDAYRIAHSFASLGNLARYEGNYTGARDAYEKSISLLRELEARHDLAANIRLLGWTCLLLGDVERAYALFNESMALHQAEQNRSGVAECLMGLGSTAIVHGITAAGARLLSAGAAIREQRSGFAWPAKPLETEPYLELARSQLSETGFQAEQAAGRAMSLEQAIEYAKNSLIESGAATATPEKPDDLSAREREVAALIAWGKTNREIADELVLSTRTVEKHAANILSKLGLSSRTQIVHWAIEHGLIQHRQMPANE